MRRPRPVALAFCLLLASCAVVQPAADDSLARSQMQAAQESRLQMQEQQTTSVNQQLLISNATPAAVPPAVH